MIGITVPDWRPAWLRSAVPFANVVQDMRIEPRSKWGRPSVDITELSSVLPATPREPVRHRGEDRQRTVCQQSFFHESLHHHFHLTANDGRLWDMIFEKAVRKLTVAS